MKVLELKGYKSLRALNAFNALMLGLKMLPQYAHEAYETFYSRVSELPESEKEKLIREAVLFVELSSEEVEALICFTTDPNGVPYRAENVKNFTPDLLVECIVAVCCEVGKIKIDLVSESEKKKLKNFSLDIRRTFAKHPELPLQEILNLAFFEAVNV